MAIFSPTEITDNYMRASVGKAASPAWRLFLLAVAAGVLIGLARSPRPRPPTAWRTPGSCGSCRGSSSPSAS